MIRTRSRQSKQCRGRSPLRGAPGRWDHIVDKEEKSVLGSEADAFSDQKVKLKKKQYRLR